MKDEPYYLIIPAAGLGTRMSHINPDLPKEMLPVYDKPAIQYAVEEGLSAGIKNIIIIISKEKGIIRKYFEDKKNYKDCSFTFLYQNNPIGESDAISLARDIVDNNPFAVIYPDNIYFPAPGALKILKKVFNEYKTEVLSLMEVKEEYAPGLGDAGRVDLKHLKNNVYRIKALHQKSRGCFTLRFKGELRICGIRISGKEVFDYIERVRAAVKQGEFTDILVYNLMFKEKKILGCRLPGTVFDIGNPTGYQLCLSSIKSNKERREL